MKRRIIFGDIHGNAIGIQRILDRINYEPIDDSLIFVGDYIDHWPNPGRDSKKAIDLIIDLEYENLNIYPLIGNHDVWMKEWIQLKVAVPNIDWMRNGGIETMQDYGLPEGGALALDFIENEIIPPNHILFFRKLLGSYMDDDLIVVHGGFRCKQDMLFAERGLSSHGILWDRTFYKQGAKSLLKCYKEIFGDKIFVCGHTPYGPVITFNPTRILIDGGSKTDGDLIALVVHEDKSYKIIGEL